MGKFNRRAAILQLFTVALLLVACATPAEGSIQSEGKITYSGDVTELYKDGTTERCQLTQEQRVVLKGEYEYNETTYVEISRHLDNPGDCDTNAYKLLIDQMSLRMNQPLFPRQNNK
jgi:hypothetical protein